MKVYKKFYLSGRTYLRLFLEVENLFNARLPSSSGFINPLTGRPWREGDPVIANHLVYHDVNEAIRVERLLPPWTPARYNDPRQVFFGMSVSF